MGVLVNGELVLYGFVGENIWQEGFTDREVLEALAVVGRDADITVRLNSGGGYVDAGMAIYNALAAHKGRVRCEVDAIAASSASLIAMAADEVVMKAGSRMMIHDPSVITFGTEEEHRRSINYLGKTAEQMASIYAEHAGKKDSDVRAAMKAETWMTAEEAVAAGYADKADGAKAKAAASFDYRIYAHAPQALHDLATTKNWSITALRRKAFAPTAQAASPPEPAASAASPGQTEESMTEKTTAAPSAEDLAKATSEATKKATADATKRIQAIMTSDKAKGREDLAAHLAYETDMSAEAAVALLEKAPVGAAAPPPAESEEAQEQRRTTATSGLAAPGGQPAKPSAMADAAWKKTLSRINAGR